jgi:HAD superfamily hydrolase (TIGR01456 family)
MTRARCVGVSFDLDGVLIRGGRALAGARTALERVRRAGLPVVFMTNGGGHPEAHRAERLSKVFGVPVRASEVVLAHSPMRVLAAGAELVPSSSACEAHAAAASALTSRGALPWALRDRRVMVLGCRDELRVAREYGLRRIVSPQAFCAQHPELYPFREFDSRAARRADPFCDEAVEAILVMHDPRDWHLELQVVVDIVTGKDPLASRRAAPAPAPSASALVPLFNASEDFVFPGAYAHPRFAQGAFLAALEHLVLLSGGAPLHTVRFGKPNKVTFDYAHALLERQLPNEAAARGFDAIFHVGDNPHADVAGAISAGAPWRAVLVSTGVWRPGDDAKGAHHEVSDVAAAVDLILAHAAA